MISVIIGRHIAYFYMRVGYMSVFVFSMVISVFFFIHDFSSVSLRQHCSEGCTALHYKCKIVYAFSLKSGSIVLMRERVMRLQHAVWRERKRSGDPPVHRSCSRASLGFSFLSSAVLLGLPLFSLHQPSAQPLLHPSLCLWSHTTPLPPSLHPSLKAKGCRIQKQQKKKEKKKENQRFRKMMGL